MKEERLSQKELEQSKIDKMMNTVNKWVGFYRENPHRFVNEVVFMNKSRQLKWFQQILLWAMFHSYFIFYLATRGQGKTLLLAIYCLVRCILYPETKIVVTAGTLKQANEVLLKIQDEIMPNSPFVKGEILECKIGQNDATIKFKNKSWIKTRTSTENARSARANVIVVDEVRMVKKKIVDSVIREFLKAPRQPGYLNNPKYKHMQERNIEIYASSAWYKSSWIWEKAQSYMADMLNDKKKYFICGLPYQVSIQSGLLMRDQVEDQMNERDFDPVSWQIEDECLFYGDTDGSLFKFDDINARRKIKQTLYPLDFYDSKNPVPKPPEMGHRILSVDVALMASTKNNKNDASSLFINDLVLADSQSFQSNFKFAQNIEGATTDELGILVMRYFYHYNCDYIVLDANGRLLPL